MRIYSVAFAFLCLIRCVRGESIKDFLTDSTGMLSQARSQNKLVVGYHVGTAPPRGKEALDQKATMFAAALGKSPLVVARPLDRRGLAPEVLRKDPIYQLINPSEIDAGGILLMVASPDGTLLEKIRIDRESPDDVLLKIAAIDRRYRIFLDDVSKAEAAAPEKQAVLLDQALASMPEEFAILGNSDLVNKIKSLDKEGSLGFRKKYTELERRVRVESKITPLLAEMDLLLKSDFDSGDFDRVFRGIDNFAKSKNLEKELKQVILIQKVRFTGQMEDLPRRIKFLQEIVDVDPSTPTGQNAAKIIGRLKDRMAAPGGKP